MVFKSLPPEQRVHNHPLYSSWRAMKARCYNPHNRKYPEYGGRGIAVCERWRQSFAAFAEDMGIRPSPAHSIERKDTNGNYEPGNCRWATYSEQSHNQRKRRGCTSRFRGVHWFRGMWVAKLTSKKIGRFVSEVEAARAYDRAAGETFGSNACLNFPLECPA